MVEHDLSEAEKAGKVHIGCEVSEQLEFKPGGLFVIQHRRHKYAPADYQQSDTGAQIVIAAKPSQPIEKGLAGPGLLAYVITSKLADHLPLYRLEKIFERHDLHLASSTMCAWMAAAAVLVTPLYRLLIERVRRSTVIHTDDTRVIASWRENFADPQMPFCIISLCTADAPQTMDNFLPPMFDAGIYIREAHYQTFRDLRASGDTRIGFVSSFDLRKSWYHPQIKIPAGERAAKWALVTCYELLKGRDAERYWLPPTIDKVEIADGQMRLTMSTEVKTRDDSEGRMVGFSIAGDDRRFYPADTNWFSDANKSGNNKPQYERNILVLSSKFVSKPVHYRYAWARNPMGNIVNSHGVLLAAQRSDDWILEETPLTPPASPDVPVETARRQAGAQIRKELERDDLERRIKEAEATIAELKPRLEKYDAERKKRNPGQP